MRRIVSASRRSQRDAGLSPGGIRGHGARYRVFTRRLPQALAGAGTGCLVQTARERSAGGALSKMAEVDGGCRRSDIGLSGSSIEAERLPGWLEYSLASTALRPTSTRQAPCSTGPMHPPLSACSIRPSAERPMVGWGYFTKIADMVHLYYK